MLATHDSSYNTRAAPTKVALTEKIGREHLFPTVHAGAEAFLRSGIWKPEIGKFLMADRH